VAIFGRNPGYDSEAHSIVRVEFARLPQEAGAVLPVFPKGSYVPRPQKPPLPVAWYCSLSPFRLPGEMTLRTNTSTHSPAVAVYKCGDVWLYKFR
jgi:hypothetical protein